MVKLKNEIRQSIGPRFVVVAVVEGRGAFCMGNLEKFLGSEFAVQPRWLIWCGVRGLESRGWWWCAAKPAAWCACACAFWLAPSAVGLPTAPASGLPHGGSYQIHQRTLNSQVLVFSKATLQARSPQQSPALKSLHHRSEKLNSWFALDRERTENWRYFSFVMERCE